MARYIAKKKCFFGNTLIEAGQEFEFSGKPEAYMIPVDPPDETPKERPIRGRSKTTGT